MFELKPIAKASIPRALEKAERYRLLNEPRQAESICLDVLAIEPEQRPALSCLLLALTDQFGGIVSGLVEQAKQLLPRFSGAYERAYYAGIISERFAKHQLAQRSPGRQLRGLRLPDRRHQPTARPRRSPPTAMTTPCYATTPACA